MGRFPLWLGRLMVIEAQQIITSLQLNGSEKQLSMVGGKCLSFYWQKSNGRASLGVTLFECVRKRVCVFMRVWIPDIKCLSRRAGPVLWRRLGAAVGKREYQKAVGEEKGAAVYSLQLNFQRVSHKVPSIQVNNEEDNVGLSLFTPGFPSRLNNELTLAHTLSFLFLSSSVCVWDSTEWAKDRVLRLNSNFSF